MVFTGGASAPPLPFQEVCRAHNRFKDRQRDADAGSRLLHHRLSFSLRLHSPDRSTGHAHVAGRSAQACGSHPDSAARSLGWILCGFVRDLRNRAAGRTRRPTAASARGTTNGDARRDGRAASEDVRDPVRVAVEGAESRRANGPRRTGAARAIPARGVCGRRARRRRSVRERLGRSPIRPSDSGNDSDVRRARRCCGRSRKWRGGVRRHWAASARRALQQQMTGSCPRA